MWIKARSKVPFGNDLLEQGQSSVSDMLPLQGKGRIRPGDFYLALKATKRINIFKFFYP